MGQERKKKKREEKKKKRPICRMAFSRSFVLVALLVALIALLCAPQPTEARFFGFRRRFRCGRRFDKFLFKRAARFGDGEDFCLNTLNGVEYDITSGVGESRCRVVCRVFRRRRSPRSAQTSTSRSS